MTLTDITSRHHAKLLRLNEIFVHWLSPLDQEGLTYILDRADYAKQIDNADGVLIGYAHDVDYPDHANLQWLRGRLDHFFYIDRIIIDSAAQGRGLGHQLYTDISEFARKRGYRWLACEVNTRPDNPSSHAFHVKQGFIALGEQAFPDKDKAVRYYAKALN